jgi:predicted O-methyltransferase YrrM
MNEKSQLNHLESCRARYKKEYESFPRTKTNIPYQYYTHNTSFSTINGEILYCMIRHFKPKKVLEIGSGNSTFVSAQALLKNKLEHNEGELVAIEPYPKQILKDGFPGLTRLIQRNLQDVPLSEFESLQENDILFIDSSHMLKLGSDVQYEYLEILPRLKKGVIVHIHDIFLPAEYPKKWIMDQHYFWNEQYLLQSFLAFNNSFEVLWACYYMHLNHSDKLAAISSSYADSLKKKNWTGPSSFWIRRIN